MTTFSLLAHPMHGPTAVRSIDVQVERTIAGGLWIEYAVSHSGRLHLPDERGAVRADGLWKATCFELFVKPPDRDAYLEFNFSPSFAWAAYAFTGYRSGMSDLPADDPGIEISDPTAGGVGCFHLSAEPWSPTLVPGAALMGLAAVIVETDGTKSYWALAHAPGPPDFHNPACFTAHLPPPARA